MEEYNVWLKHGKFDTYFTLEEDDDIPDGEIVFSGSHEECKQYIKDNPLKNPFILGD